MAEQSVRDERSRTARRARMEYPDAVISECNYGEGTLTTP